MPIATSTGLPGTAVRPSRHSANGESGRSYALEMRPRPPGASLFFRGRGKSEEGRENSLPSSLLARFLGAFASDQVRDAGPRSVARWPRLAGPRRRHVLVRQDRPALVVAPPAVDLQVARREALQAEAGSLGERDRALVAGLDVRLEPVQPQ